MANEICWICGVNSESCDSPIRLDVSKTYSKHACRECNAGMRDSSKGFFVLHEEVFILKQLAKRIAKLEEEWDHLIILLGGRND